MEFITVEQFKEQPKEVQEVFLDWWKPSIGDIYVFINEEWNNSLRLIECCNSELQSVITERYKGINARIPLFAEGQLRKFIEDKTGYKVDCCFYGEKYDINTCEDDGLYIKKYEDIDDDLLQAYWKVACMVAKEGLNG